MEILSLWRYFAQVTIDGKFVNDFWYELPAKVQDAAMTLGTYIIEILFPMGG